MDSGFKVDRQAAEGSARWFSIGRPPRESGMEIVPMTAIRLTFGPISLDMPMESKITAVAYRREVARR